MAAKLEEDPHFLDLENYFITAINYNEDGTEATIECEGEHMHGALQAFAGGPTMDELIDTFTGGAKDAEHE